MIGRLNISLRVMQGFAFITKQEVATMFSKLSLQDKEDFLAEHIKDLAAESKSRIFGFTESNLTVVTGSVVNLNSDVAINIQSGSGFDPETVFRALADFRKSERGAVDKNK